MSNASQPPAPTKNFEMVHSCHRGLPCPACYIDQCEQAMLREAATFDAENNRLEAALFAAQGQNAQLRALVERWRVLGRTERAEWNLCADQLAACLADAPEPHAD